MAEIELALAGQTVPLSTIGAKDSMGTLTTGRYIVPSSALASQLGIIGGSLGGLGFVSRRLLRGRDLLFVLGDDPAQPHQQRRGGLGKLGGPRQQVTTGQVV